ncbi:MarR family winged helix-turn-helix transcriptional regulator [Kribbella deserti]|uniref:MarR family winged helix-turn-helix transcriptional regulator n=1 Tax=Kribbella deserti TaxID=1926257 RepID=A0ABV6QFL3_9ACTN
MTPPDPAGGSADAAAGWPADAPATPVDVLIALRLAGRASRKAMAEELAGNGVHVGQELVLVKLAHLGSLPVAQLAKVLDVEVPTASRTAQRMEAAGLVHRVKATKGDARLVSIELTSKGVEAAEAVRAMHERAGVRLTRGLDEPERRQLRDLLWRLATNGDAIPS